MLEERALYFFIIVILTLAGLAWGLLDTRRVIEAPFLYAMGSALILLPQLYVAASQGVRVPDQAYLVFCIMVILCTLALYLGYSVSPRQASKKTNHKKLLIVEPNQLYILGFVTAIAGSVGVFELGTLGTITAWRGWPVYWVTLSTFIVPGITLMMVAYICSPNLWKLLPVLLFTYVPLTAIFEYGRRSSALTLPLVFAIPLLLYRRNLRIPRWLIVLGLTCAFFVVYAFPVWRDHFKEHNYVQLFRDHPPSEIFDNLFADSRTDPLEITDGMIVTGATYARSSYEWGAGFYNMVIQNYVPGSLIGYDLKNSLFVGNGIGQGWVTEVYNIPVASYTSKSGFQDLFSQFSFLGCLITYLIGREFRRAHEAATQKRDARAIIFLCFFASIPAGIAYAPLTIVVALSLPEVLLMLVAFKWCVQWVPVTAAFHEQTPVLAPFRSQLIRPSLQSKIPTRSIRLKMPLPRFRNVPELVQDPDSNE
jgi:hypothetical protein